MAEQRLVYPPITTEESQALWRGVLSRGLEDALLGRELDDAAWPRPENPDFVRVCDWSGLDPAYVLRKFQQFQLGGGQCPA